MITAKGRSSLSAVRGSEEIRSARTARADEVEQYGPLDHAIARDRLHYLSGLSKFDVGPDTSKWHAQYEPKDDSITAQAKLLRQGETDQIHVFLHEAGHRGQEIDRGTYESFKDLHLNQLSSFLAMANPVHLKDFERTGKVDSLAAEVFAESYARACLGLPLPAPLAEFWQRRFEEDDTGFETQSNAEYIATWPNKITRCQRCTMFIKASRWNDRNRCSKVDGWINAHGHCKHFEIGQPEAALADA